MKTLLLTLALVASTCMSALAATPVDHTKTYTFRTDTVYIQRDGLKIFGIAYTQRVSMKSGHWSSMHTA